MCLRLVCPNTHSWHEMVTPYLMLTPSQVQSDTGHDSSLPSGRINSAQQARNAQQAQSVCHLVKQGPPAHQGYFQKGSSIAAPSAQQALQAQQAQHALQQDRAAAQELLMLSRQAPCESLPRAQHAGQAGQTTYPQRLSPALRAGSGQLGAAPHTATFSYLPGQAVPVNPGQIGPAGPEDLSRAGSGQSMRAGSDQLMRAASDQLVQNAREMSGQISGQLPKPTMPPQGNLGRAGCCAASLLNPQVSDLQNLQENLAVQLQQRSRSYPPPQGMQPAGPGNSMATQQQQQQEQNGEPSLAVPACTICMSKSPDRQHQGMSEPMGASACPAVFACHGVWRKEEATPNQ